MGRHRILLVVTATVAFGANGAAAQAKRSNGGSGTAVVRFVTEPSGASGNFYLNGTPDGGTSAGGSLLAVRLRPGKYKSVMADPGPGFELASIACDDAEGSNPSAGDVSERSVTFNIGAGEMVSCVFTVVSRLSMAGAQMLASMAVGANAFESSADWLRDFAVPAFLPPGAGTFQVPREGLWNATNSAGRMIRLRSSAR